MAWTERYVSTAGGGAHDGTSEANAWTLAEAITNAAAGQRINIKKDSGYTDSSDRTFANAGTDASAIWWRGYNSTIGDLASSNTLADFPSIALTGAGSQNLITGAYQWFTDLAFTSVSTTASTGTFHPNAVGIRADHCLLENTATNSASLALSPTGSSDGFVCTRCRIISTTTSTYAAAIPNNGTSSFIGNWFEGAGLNASSPGVVAFNVFDDVAGTGVNVGAVGVSILNNSFYSCGGSSIVIAAAANSCLIANNIIANSAAYGINSSAATSSAIHILNNLFYSNSSGNLNGILESQVFGSISDDGSSPYTNAASDDFSLVTGSNGKAAAFPGLFLGETATGYLDCGAVQRQESSGSSGGGMRLVGHGGLVEKGW